MSSRDFLGHSSNPGIVRTEILINDNILEICHLGRQATETEVVEWECECEYETLGQDASCVI
jgi:hypothetical protein